MGTKTEKRRIPLPAPLSEPGALSKRILYASHSDAPPLSPGCSNDPPAEIAECGPEEGAVKSIKVELTEEMRQEIADRAVAELAGALGVTLSEARTLIDEAKRNMAAREPGANETAMRILQEKVNAAIAMHNERKLQGLATDLSEKIVTTDTERSPTVEELKRWQGFAMNYKRRNPKASEKEVRKAVARHFKIKIVS